MGGRQRGRGGTTETYQRYAPYIENYHENTLNATASYRVAALAVNPYEGYTAQNTEEAFFGAGYMLSSFPSLYDMFGRFMAGLDIEVIWAYVFSNRIKFSAITEHVLSEFRKTDDSFVRENLNPYKLKMRAIEAVGSSSFIVGNATLELERLKQLGKLSIASISQQIESINEQANTYLNWQKVTITNYALILKSYFQAEIDNTTNTQLFATYKTIWPFTILDFERAVLGTLKTKVPFIRTPFLRERSALSKTLLVASYTAQGAFIGSAVGGPGGAITGAVVGFFMGVAAILTE